MRFALRLTALAVIAASWVAFYGACNPELGEAFNDVEEASPSVCEDFCVESVDCTWEDMEGNEENGAFDETIRRCIISCAYPIEHGAYVYEIQSNGDTEFKDHVSGKTYKNYYECVWDQELYDCDDDANVYGLEIDSESKCEDFNDCLDILEIDVECDWKDDYDLCECVYDEWLW